VQTDIKALQKALNVFMKMCGFAIKLSKARITPAHLPFQVRRSISSSFLLKFVVAHDGRIVQGMVEKHYGEMREKILRYIKEE
jgi:hypothetical protein